MTSDEVVKKRLASIDAKLAQLRSVSFDCSPEIRNEISKLCEARAKFDAREQS